MDKSSVPQRRDFERGDIILNEYTIQKTLGEGSFGKVYLVSDKSGQQFAFKILRLWEVPPDIRQELNNRFEREFKIGSIECDNLVHAVRSEIRCESIGYNSYILMEYCPNGDLNAKLGQDNNETRNICRQILNGLKAMHKHGYVHRDLKPENVLFKRNGLAALTDFGVGGDAYNRMTLNWWKKPEQIMGTYAYMSPEQQRLDRGDATVKPTTDIFSFGVLAYQLVTGNLPFGPLNSHNDLVLYQQNSKKGLWKRELLLQAEDGRAWESMIAGCLEPDRHKRLQTVDHVLSLLPASSKHQYIPSIQQTGCPYRLQVVDGEERGRLYELKPQYKRLFLIGRDSNNTIAVKSDVKGTVSRQHCTIETNEDANLWIIRDGQWISNKRQWEPSRNGTFVNSVPVSPNGYRLYHGDIITIGDVSLRFEETNQSIKL